MKNCENTNSNLIKRSKEIHLVRDLIDFYSSWPVHRETVIKLADAKGLSEEEHLTLDWLVCMVDRISDRDLN